MKQNRFFSLLSLLVLAMFLMGCPYFSDLPLSEPIYKIADNLIGEWELSGATDGDIVIVRRTGANTMNVIKKAGSDGSETIYAAHITEIKGELFLNVKEEDDYGTYYFYKLKTDGDFKLILMPVTSYIRETFESSAAMKAFFEANAHNSYFYTTDEETYYKKK